MPAAVREENGGEDVEDNGMEEDRIDFAGLHRRLCQSGLGFKNAARWTKGKPDPEDQ